MNELRYTLVSDGSSDRALLPLLTWVLRQRLPDTAIQPEWADLGQIPPRRKKSLADRIQVSLELYPCDLLFVHRDAETAARAERIDEIQSACSELDAPSLPPVVCVVPVRMQEAWLLFDETAIRQAAGNPNGSVPLLLPSLKTIEDLPDPKAVLYELLREASGLPSRRRKRFPASERAIRVSDSIEEFSPLRTLSAFAELERELDRVQAEQSWTSTG